MAPERRNLFTRALRRRVPRWRQLNSRRQTVFQGFWHGPPLGVLYRACLRSFTELGYRFHLYTYEPVDVPPGIDLLDANEIIPFEEIFYYRNPITGSDDLSPFSDLFRFRLLGIRGGWWTDIDSVCLSSDIPEVQSAWAREFPEHSPSDIGTSQLALGVGSDLAHRLYTECLALSRSTFDRRESLGPDLLSRIVGERGLPRDNFGNTALFYPIRWIEAFKLWLPHFFDEIASKTAGAKFLPLYQTVAQYQGIDVSRPPPAGSYLDHICERFEVSSGDRLRQDAATVLSGARGYFVENDWAAGTMRAIAGGEETLHTLGLGR
jgi:hypothetical protein